ncbi:MAG: hypothetical protein PHX41_02400 [Kiritimatiellae bacterium]|nr:hypothetical protein [Kiritimatiellia bacterium]
MILDMRQAIGYLSAVMTCAAVWFAAGSAGSARAGCNPAPGEVCCETDVTEECEEPAKVLLNGCSGMCEALPPGPGGEVALASSVDFTTEAGLKRMRYDRHGVADDCDPAVWEEVEEFSAAPEFTWTLSGPGCSESGVGSTASGTATQAGTYTVTFNATCDDECSEFPNGTSVSAVLTVLPPMTLSFSPAMLGLDRTDDGGEHKEGEASVEASVCPDAEPFYTWAPKAGVCGIPPGQPTEGASLTAVTYRTPDKEQCSSSYMDQIVSVDVSPRGSVSSNLFTVVKLDVTVGGVAEADEETEGAFVKFVSTSYDGIEFNQEASSLKQVSIEFNPKDVPDTETVSITCGGVLYELGDDLKLHIAENEYQANEISDKTFFLAGSSPSSSLKDKEIVVTHANSEAVDKAKFTVVRIVLEPIHALAPNINPSGMARGTTATYKIDAVQPEVLQSAIGWEVKSGPVSISGNPNQLQVLVSAGTSDGEFCLNVNVDTTVEGLSTYDLPPPFIKGCVLEKLYIPVCFFLIANDDGSGCNPKPSLTFANMLFQQAGVEFFEVQTTIVCEDFYQNFYPTFLVIPFWNAVPVFGVKVFCINKFTNIFGVEDTETRGVTIYSMQGDGVVLRNCAQRDHVFAHELGHACGLADIYPVFGPLREIKRHLIPQDCSGLYEKGYYSSSVDMDSLIQRLLMNGYNDPSCKDISYGPVFGKGKNGSSALQNTGVSGMNRQPSMN